MEGFCDAHDITERYADYVEELRKLLSFHGVGSGISSDVKPLADKLEENKPFRTDFATLVRAIHAREQSRMSLEEILTVVALAHGGEPLVRHLASAEKHSASLSALRMLLNGIGTWAETGRIQHLRSDVGDSPANGSHPYRPSAGTQSLAAAAQHGNSDPQALELEAKVRELQSQLELLQRRMATPGSESAPPPPSAPVSWQQPLATPGHATASSIPTGNGAPATSTDSPPARSGRGLQGAIASGISLHAREDAAPAFHVTPGQNLPEPQAEAHTEQQLSTPPVWTADHDLHTGSEAKLTASETPAYADELDGMEQAELEAYGRLEPQTGPPFAHASDADNAAHFEAQSPNAAASLEPAPPIQAALSDPDEFSPPSLIQNTGRHQLPPRPPADFRPHAFRSHQANWGLRPSPGGRSLRGRLRNSGALIAVAASLVLAGGLFAIARSGQSAGRPRSTAAHQLPSPSPSAPASAPQNLASAAPSAATFPVLQNAPSAPTVVPAAKKIADTARTQPSSAPVQSPASQASVPTQTVPIAKVAGERMEMPRRQPAAEDLHDLPATVHSGSGAPTPLSIGLGTPSSRKAKSDLAASDGGASTPDTTPSSSKSGGPVEVPPAAMEKRLISSKDPVYPPQALLEHLDGKVVLSAFISRDGTVKRMDVVEGEPVFLKSAMAAVSWRRYKPYLVAGKPVEVVTRITVKYPTR